MGDAWPFGALRPLSFDTIVCDPPWSFELRSETGSAKSALAHYDTMPLDDIKALPVGQLARGDCLLLLWCCSWMLPQALDVIDAWGFTYKTELIWRKTTVNGKVRVGPGYRARTMHEPILLATIGNPRHKPFPSIFDGLAREHSRKPDAFFDMVERHVPAGFWLELFSRQSRPGWTTWGDEAGKFDPPTDEVA